MKDALPAGTVDCCLAMAWQGQGKLHDGQGSAKRVPHPASSSSMLRKIVRSVVERPAARGSCSWNGRVYCQPILTARGSLRAVLQESRGQRTTSQGTSATVFLFGDANQGLRAGTERSTGPRSRSHSYPLPTGFGSRRAARSLSSSTNTIWGFRGSQCSVQLLDCPTPRSAAQVAVVIEVAFEVFFRGWIQVFANRHI